MSDRLLEELWVLLELITLICTLHLRRYNQWQSMDICHVFLHGLCPNSKRLGFVLFFTGTLPNKHKVKRKLLIIVITLVLVFALLFLGKWFGQCSNLFLIHFMLLLLSCPNNQSHHHKYNDFDFGEFRFFDCCGNGSHFVQQSRYPSLYHFHSTQIQTTEYASTICCTVRKTRINYSLYWSHFWSNSNFVSICLLFLNLRILHSLFYITVFHCCVVVVSLLNIGLGDWFLQVKNKNNSNKQHHYYINTDFFSW
jgi:hypothetical protein